MAEGDSHEALNGNLDVELRRGVLVLVVLSQLRTPEYGYSLRQALDDQGMAIEEGTLYPLLRRLESQGLLGAITHLAPTARATTEASAPVGRVSP